MSGLNEPGSEQRPGPVDTSGIPDPFSELVNSFRALKGSPRGFWYANYIYWLDGVAYVGMLTLLAM